MFLYRFKSYYTTVIIRFDIEKVPISFYRKPSSDCIKDVNSAKVLKAFSSCPPVDLLFVYFYQSSLK